MRQYFWFWQEALTAGITVAVIVILITLFSKMPARKKLLWSAFSGYLVIVFFLTMLPIIVTSNRLSWQTVWETAIKTPFDPLLRSAEVAREYLAYGQYGPFKRFLLNVGGNLILLIPFAFFVRMLSRLKYRYVLLLTCLASVFIEGSQALLNRCTGTINRIVDVNDVILNVGGAALFIFFMFLVSAMKKQEPLYTDR